MKKHLLAAAAMALASSATLAQVAAVDWPGNPQNVFSNGPYMMGYQFSVSISQMAVGLGAFDDQGDGFATGRHHVGLWTDSGVLLADAFVTSADALQGHFRYTSIAGVQLLAGQTYIVGADNWGGGGDNWAWRETGGMGLVEAPGIKHIQDKFQDGPGFAFPNLSEGNMFADFVNLRNNPLSSGMARIHFGLSKDDRVEIKVYDVTGREVRELANRQFKAGEHDIVWDGSDNSGRPVARGVYFTQVRYKDSAFSDAKKLTVLK